MGNDYPLAAASGGCDGRHQSISDSKLAEIRDRLRQGFGARFKTSEFNRALKELRSQPQRHTQASTLPAIVINDKHVRDITSESLRALHHVNDEPRLFVRGGEIVRVCPVRTRLPDGQEDIRSVIAAVTEDQLRSELDRSANFMRTGKDGLKPTVVPMVVVNDILSQPELWPFPSLSSLAEAPTLRADGSILSQPGYDRCSVSLT